MKKLYSVDHQQDTRRVRPEIVLLGVIIVLSMATGLFVTYDLSKNPTLINEVENQPVLGAIEPDDEYKEVEKENYSLEIPTNWVEVNPPEVIVKGQRYFPVRYQGTTGKNIGRILEIYEGQIPALLPINKVLRVSVTGNSITPIEISPQCSTFTDLSEPDGLVVPGRWSDIEFACRAEGVSNIVGALSGDQSQGIVLTHQGRSERYLLVYTDHGSEQDNSIFFDILRSFKLK